TTAAGAPESLLTKHPAASKHEHEAKMNAFMVGPRLPHSRRRRSGLHGWCGLRRSRVCRSAVRRRRLLHVRALSIELGRFLAVVHPARPLMNVPIAVHVVDRASLVDDG